MIKELTHREAQDFIMRHENDDPVQLALKYSSNKELPFQLLVAQIKSRQKAKEKLPNWYNINRVIFPHGVPMEQCSSERTAKYKAKLVKGSTLVDLTGGSGVDTFYLSKNFEQTTYVEQNEALCELAVHNFSALDSKINVEHKTSEDFLDSATDSVDWFYIDPARRSETNKKVFKIEDCQPDLLGVLPKILAKGANVMVKLSPMLDIKEALNTLSNIKEVHVVSVKNECKEILLLINSGFQSEPKIIATNILSNNTDRFDFSYKEELAHRPIVSEPQKYLYEPNASILKAGAFKTIAVNFGLQKLHPNSHLYTSEDIIENFPGRTFNIEGVIAVSNKALKKQLEGGKANLSTRNFPMNTAQLKKKLKIKDGGSKYIFATTIKGEDHKLIVCEKVS